MALTARSFVLHALAAAALAAPALASAQQTAYTSALLNLRAGPSPDFPVVAVLQPGVVVAVQGCTTGYSWCDVAVDGNLRGWVFAQYLTYPSGPQYVPFTSAAIGIGVPLVAFSLGAYWGNYYADRPWYGRPPPGWGRPPPPRPPGMRPPHRPGYPGGPGVGPGRPPGGGGPGMGGPGRPPGGPDHGRPPHVRPPQGGGGHPGGGPGRPPGGGGGGGGGGHHGGGRN
jgi:uncharacterized protein YraI